MPDGLDRLLAYSAQLIAKGPKSFEVEELADPKTGEPLRVFVLPMTAREKAAVLGHLDAGDRMAAAVETVIQRARDEHGAPLFTANDVEAIMDMRLGSLIESIAIRIGELWSSVTAEEARGN